MRHGFDDSGRRVPVVGFRYPSGDEPVAPRPDRSADARTWVRLLQWLVSGGDVVDAGKRAILLAFLLRLPGSARSVRELARALGLPHVTAWRRLKQLRSELAQISRE